MTNRILIVVSLIASSFLISCHKDVDGGIRGEVLTSFTAVVYQEVTSSIVGYVYDENNLPVRDADVAIYSTVTKTNEYGVFVFKNVKVDQQGTYIKVLKNGFILGSDFVYPEAGKTSFSFVKMLSLDNKYVFENSTGGEFEMNDGARIIFDVNSISDINGNDYSGKVYTTCKYLNPNDKDLGNVMPGGLMADAANGNTYVLGTLGMMAVELRDGNGNELQIKSNNSATLEFPALTEFKPNEIALWSFDENKGRWKEEGKAKLEGNKYIARVNHFSFWNCDAPYPLINVCGKIIYKNGSPAVNIGIKVSVDGLGTYYGQTNSEGDFCGKMPKGQPITIIVNHRNCTEILKEKVFGPFENNVQLDDIIVDNVQNVGISGNLLCNSNPVKDGVVVVKIKQSTLVYLVKEDGSFDIDLTNFMCGDVSDILTFGFDEKTSEASSVQTFDGGKQTKDISINVCSSICNLTSNMIFDCFEKITVNATGGTGNYEYRWDDLSNEPYFIINNPDSTFQSQVYCVTVTDIGINCEKIFCKTIFGKLYPGIEVNCANESMQVYANVGSGSLSYLWNTGQVTEIIKVSAVGDYCVTVTDSNGCSSEVCKFWKGPLVLNSTPTSCSNNKYNFTSDNFDYGTYSSPGTNIFGNLIYPISTNVFETGFNFTISLSNESCNIRENVKLPQLIKGLTTSINNTSCGTCSDGKINITINSNADCYLCKIGQIKIFKIGDLTNDLSSNNNQNEMPKGEYYVVVTDEASGCYIGFEKVKIQ